MCASDHDTCGAVADCCQGAIKDVEEVLQIEPNNKVARQRKPKLEHLENERLEKLKTETFDKLKVPTPR